MSVIDAKNKSIGRVASEAAILLQGKNRVDYDPAKVQVENLVIKNVQRIRFTGKKQVQKIYYRYTGYSGGLKPTLLKNLWEKYPDRVVRLAIRGMLPKNKLRDKLMKKVIIEM